VACKICSAAVDLPPGADPHAVTWCGCCARDHHHGEEAANCGPDNHEGPCWNPPAAGIRLELQPGAVHVRPPGCTVCRPVAHYPVAGEVRPG
jgi:hypothetical protein